MQAPEPVSSPDVASTLRPIERVRSLSPRDFESLLLQDRPVIVEDVASRWHAFGAWDGDELVRRIGTLRMRVRSSATHVHPDFDRLRAQWSRPWVHRVLAAWRARSEVDTRDSDPVMTFGEFVELLRRAPQASRFLAGAEELVLCRRGEWNDELSVLRPDLELPAYVPRDRLESAALWVSAKGVRSHLHYDGGRVHNLNAQVRGSKQVQLYAPTQMAKLYPYEYTRGRPHTFSQVNVEAPDDRRFPLFHGAEGYAATLNAGDMLLIPAYWYHTFKHLGDFNVNVNFWWRADAVRLSPVAAREYLGNVFDDILGRARIPPFWLLGLLRRIEQRITQDADR